MRSLRISAINKPHNCIGPTNPFNKYETILKIFPMIYNILRLNRLEGCARISDIARTQLKVCKSIIIKTMRIYQNNLFHDSL